jgi:hypothetical protein
VKQSGKPLAYKLAWICFFAVWMAYVESAIVVYLRTLYYPDGFQFPIKFIPVQMAWIEAGREMATLFMLAAVAFLASRKALIRLAYFMLSFGTWDIGYYIWLKIFLNWPESLFTWDLLFLIPVPWVAPILAPLIVSLSFIIGAGFILYADYRGIPIQILKNEWIGLAVATLLIFISFILEAPGIIRSEAPAFYHWELLILGEVIGFVVLFRTVKRLKKWMDMPTS